MSEGEHTIISKIPREPWNQIASRKLAALASPIGSPRRLAAAIQAASFAPEAAGA